MSKATSMNPPVIRKEIKRGKNYYGPEPEWFGTPQGGQSRRIRPSEDRSKFTNILVRVPPTTTVSLIS